MTGQSTPRSDRTRLVVAVLVGLVGLVWVAQGLGAPIGGGVMVGDKFWALAGAVLVALAVGYATLPRLRRR